MVLGMSVILDLKDEMVLRYLLKEVLNEVEENGYGSIRISVGYNDCQLIKNIMNKLEG